MSYDRNKALESLARHRETWRAKGFRETTVWVHDATQEIVDRLIQEGRFKNRKAALNHAIERYFAEKTEAMGH